MTSTQNWKGVPMPDAVREALDTGRLDDPYPSGWMRGVDDALASRPDTPVRTEVDTPPEVQALMAVMDEDTDSAQRIVGRMSGRDRAVLSYYLTELSAVVDMMNIRVY